MLLKVVVIIEIKYLVKIVVQTECNVFRHLTAC